MEAPKGPWILLVAALVGLLPNALTGWLVEFARWAAGGRLSEFWVQTLVLIVAVAAVRVAVWIVSRSKPASPQAKLPTWLRIVTLVLLVLLLCVAVAVGLFSTNHVLPQVPDLTGKSQAQAIDRLAGSPLAFPEVIPTVWTDQADRGQVIKGTVDPPPGLRVRRGSLVSFEVSLGRFPQLIGMTRQEAESALQALGLHPRVVWREAPQDDEKVLDQQSRDGSGILPGGEVVLTVGTSDVPRLIIRTPNASTPAKLYLQGGRYLFEVSGDSAGLRRRGLTVLLYVDPRTGDQGRRLQLDPLTLGLDGRWEGTAQLGNTRFAPETGQPGPTLTAVAVRGDEADRLRHDADAGDPNATTRLPDDRVAECIIPEVPFALPGQDTSVRKGVR